MRRNKVLRVFHDRYPLVGPVLWALNIQYFVTQLIVGLDWAKPYSVRFNTISDLGNTHCGQYGSMIVCSPLHNAMNASFIVLGLFIIAGSVLIYQEFHKTRGSATGFICMGLAGFGTLVVGLFPENTISAAHIFGASLPFFLGNVSMTVLGAVLTIPRKLRAYTIASGVLGLVGLVLFLSKHYSGLGAGGMERITAYPQTIWLIVFGIYMWHNRYQQSNPAKR